MYQKSLSAPLSDRELMLWNGTVDKLLVQPLWEKRDISDSAQHLMVPLHAAFQSKDRRLQEDFAEHFRQFLSHVREGGSEYRVNDLIERLEYLYFASQFMLLSCIYGSEVPNDLYVFVLEEALNTYKTFGGPWDIASSKDMKTRIIRIISGEKILDQNYYRAVTDFEFYTLAIMCDLLSIEKFQKRQSTSTALLEEASELTFFLFKSEADFTSDGGWVFQPGVWSDHPNYVHAGNAAILPNLQISIVKDIGMDSSHFHRLPLQLRSYLYSQQSNEGRQFFITLTSGLKTQLVTRVLVQPSSDVSSFRMNNFMSGHNGVFRYSYHVEGVGYGPYQLSRTFLLGWWSFLADNDLSNVYKVITSYFPLDEASKIIYSDPVTIRDQNVLYSSRSQESEQLLELICSLASKLR